MSSGPHPRKGSKVRTRPSCRHDQDSPRDLPGRQRVCVIAFAVRSIFFSFFLFSLSFSFFLFLSLSFSFFLLLSVSFLLSFVLSFVPLSLGTRPRKIPRRRSTLRAPSYTLVNLRFFRNLCCVCAVVFGVVCALGSGASGLWVCVV